VDARRGAPFLVGQQAARLMRENKPNANGAKGTIIFTNASAALKGFPLSGAFAMACQAKSGLAQSMARELMPEGIHIVSVPIDAAIGWTQEDGTRAHRLAGTSVDDNMADPDRIDVRGDLICGRDVSIDVNCVFEGHVVLADNVRIGPNCVLQDAEVGPGSIVGPFARLRPGTVLGADVHVGNFVEVKNSTIADHSKANHLAYVGDATVGQRVNIGAGTITCNYDGANKFRTVIEDDAFIGSDTQLGAPVTVGRGATLGAGTTLTKDAPPGQLTLSRARQLSLAGWKRPVKQKKD
jgi:bifunctional N-acetylglucosamine-1-phosphate-uridyltransferase/glucosamine-1-phosphate-acetyltransferase GlmU-like protein